MKYTCQRCKREVEQLGLLYSVFTKLRGEETINLCAHCVAVVVQYCLATNRLSSKDLQQIANGMSLDIKK